MSSSRLVAGGTSWWLKAMNDVTRILSAIEQGDPSAAGQLLPLIYDELRKLAAHKPTAVGHGGDSPASSRGRLSRRRRWSTKRT
jgi:plasmid stabilization system protein ParE